MATATSLYKTSILTSVSGAAYEAVTSLRDGSRYKNGFLKTPKGTEPAGIIAKLGTEAGLVVIVLTGAVEWLGRALLYAIAKIASCTLPKSLDYSQNASGSLLICTNATAAAAYSLVSNLCGSGMANRVTVGDSVRKVIGFVTCHLCGIK